MKKLLLAGLSAFALSGCVSQHTPVSNTVADLNNLDLTKSYRMGEDCITNFLIFTGTADAVTAAKNAGITKVAYVNQEFSYFLLFSTHCVQVYGE